MILEEALKNFSAEEKEIHELVKDKSIETVFGYVLKSQFYQEPTKEEIDAINDMYENGITFKTIKIREKVHTFRLLTGEDKRLVKELIDIEFNGPNKSKNFTNEDLKQEVIREVELIYTLAQSLDKIGEEVIEQEAMVYLQSFKGDRLKKIDMLKAKAMLLEKLPFAMLKTLHDRYTEWENRIFDLLQYESILKK